FSARRAGSSAAHPAAEASSAAANATQRVTGSENDDTTFHLPEQQPGKVVARHGLVLAVGPEDAWMPNGVAAVVLDRIDFLDAPVTLDPHGHVSGAAVVHRPVA